MDEADEDVRFPLRQADEMPFGDELDSDSGIFQSQFGKALGQEEGRDAFHRGNADPSYRGGVVRAQRLRDRRGFLLDPLSNRKQPMAVFRQHEAIRLSVEQFDGEAFFQLGDTPADGRMVDLEPARSRRKATLPGQFQKVDQVVPVEHEAPSWLSSDALGSKLACPAPFCGISVLKASPGRPSFIEETK
jgi:hypothetical protein